MRVFATKANVKTDILKRNDYDVLSKCKMALNHQCIVFNSLVKDNIVACVTWKMRNKYATCQTRFGFSGCFLNADHHRISRCFWFLVLRKAKKKCAFFFFFNKGKCQDGHLEKETTMSFYRNARWRSIMNASHSIVLQRALLHSPIEQF